MTFSTLTNLKCRFLFALAVLTGETSFYDSRTRVAEVGTDTPNLLLFSLIFFY